LGEAQGRYVGPGRSHHHYHHHRGNEPYAATQYLAPMRSSYRNGRLGSTAEEMALAARTLPGIAALPKVEEAVEGSAGQANRRNGNREGEEWAATQQLGGAQGQYVGSPVPAYHHHRGSEPYASTQYLAAPMASSPHQALLGATTGEAALGVGQGWPQIPKQPRFVRRE
jgi:hypothetical protein